MNKNISIGDYVEIFSGDVGEVTRVLEDHNGKVYQVRFLGDSIFHTRYIHEDKLTKVTEEKLLCWAKVLLLRLVSAIYDSTKSQLVREYIKGIDIDY